MKATMEQVAQRAGVSKALVSRYLNEKPGVSPESAARIRAAIEHYHYRRPGLAEGNALAIVLEGVSSFHRQLLRACMDAALEHGHVMSIIENFGDDAVKEKSASILSQGCVEGVIVYGSALEDKAMIDILLQNGTPLVLVENDLPGVEAEKILIDNYQGQYGITRLLIEAGYRDIRMIPWDLSARAGTERLAGFLAALRDNGIEPGGSYVYPPEQQGYEGVYQVVERLHSAGSLPEAIVCSGDTTALYVLASFMKLGIRVPRDVAVTGFDGATADSFTNWAPSITTMRQPLYDMGAYAVERLLDRIKNPGGPTKTTVFHSEFVQGETTRTLMKK